MKKYYVSLVKDLLGVYLQFEADSKEAVHLYLESEYYRNGMWGIPWCAVYTEEDLEAGVFIRLTHLVIPKCGPLYKEDFAA